MGMLEQLRANKKVSGIAGATLIAAGVLGIAFQVRSFGPSKPQTFQVFYTTDDGKTLFAGGEDLKPPFRHNGAEAVRAHVYQCDGKQFVGYLERYNAASKKIFDEYEQFLKIAKKGDQPPPVVYKIEGAQRSGHEYRRPGETKWVPQDTPDARKILEVKCPDGVAGTPKIVDP